MFWGGFSVYTAFEPDALQTVRALALELAQLRGALERVRSGSSDLVVETHVLERSASAVGSLVAGLPLSAESHQLALIWRRCDGLPLFDPAQPATDMRARLAQVDAALGLLGEMRFICAQLSVPDRIRHWLAGARPGYSLPFHDLFAADLPDAADRQRLLEQLAWAPEALPGGLVDVRRGLILRHHIDRIGLWASVAVVASALALATAAAAGVAHVPDPGWPLAPSDMGASLSSWLALVAGVVVHGAVDAVKREDSGALVPPVAPVDLVRYVDARLGALLVGVVLALVAHTGFAVVAGRTHLTPLNGFLLGYGLDSAVGLVITALELRSGRQLADLGRMMSRR
jgi:hypothetical protein